MKHVKTPTATNYNTPEVINNVYELPKIEPTTINLHDAAGFPTKSTWLKSTQRVNYLTRPLINTKNVTKSPPEYEEKQKGHTR